MTQTAPCRSIAIRTALIFFACLLPLGCQLRIAGPPPPVVEVASVLQENVPIYREWVGTTDGFATAAIRAQVQGYIIRIDYKEGDIVQKGQVLFEIDPRPFEAALSQAKADLARSRAQYTASLADLRRVRPLAAQNAVSQRDLQNAEAAEQSAGAAVRASQAALRQAELNLAFSKVTSPLQGIAGLAQVNVGDLVGPGQAGSLTVVSTIDPTKVYYSISEQFYLSYMEQFSPNPANDLHKKPLEHELILADGSLYPVKGELFALDRQVDMQTGTIRVVALFANPANFLRPGQFVRVRVLTGIRKGALLVPQRAVTEIQVSYEVAVVDSANTVQIRMVKVGEQVGTLWIIEEGLRPGERVIAEGTQKVKPGMKVRPIPFSPASPASKGSP